MTFYTEANRAIQAGVWFAAASVAASALEAILLSRCLLHRNEVKALPKWATLKRNRSGFGVFARSMDLGKLLEIAGELSWFPEGGIPKGFVKLVPSHLDIGFLESLGRFFQGTPNVDKLCASHLREFRNLLHPAVCLKEGHQPSPEAGQVASILFLIAISSLGET